MRFEIGLQRTNHYFVPMLFEISLQPGLVIR